MSRLVAIITADDARERDRSIEDVCLGLGIDDLLAEALALDRFRRVSGNLYERVRALFMLAAIHRFFLPRALGTGRSSVGIGASAPIPAPAVDHLLGRRFEEAIDLLLARQQAACPSASLSSALAAAYREFGLQTLANQVRRSVRSIRGNQWMFRVGHPIDHPLRVRGELLRGRGSRASGPFPLLHESTPVRMDLSHAGWSDIFFLGMDCPEAARVLNVSIDLGVHGRDAAPRPPVEAFLRVIDEPVLRLTSVDLDATADIDDVAEVFDFGRDHLGLLKAAVIAAGVVPPGVEGSGTTLADLFRVVVGPGLGLELVSSVNGIPKGSRLAVSTTLLASMISVCMRATGQTAALTGALDERERRLVAARAILGEWLGGSGGGWQDSGGVWPAAKLIRGVVATEGDPEFGVSRGRLLPRHDAVPLGADLQESLVLVHGGMAQNVGPILEMVTEKYLLRSGPEWRARADAGAVLDEILAAVAVGDVRRIAAATTRNFSGPIQAIIPWASNAYTEALIDDVRGRFGERFWGFWMLGGMSGGGMGFIFDPRSRLEGQEALAGMMASAKRRLENGLPFAMEPVVYDFAVNTRGTWCDMLEDAEALMPYGYYARTVPELLRTARRELPDSRRLELERFGAACRTRPELAGMVHTLFDRLLPPVAGSGAGGRELRQALETLGFDEVEHEQIRADLRAGRIGLAQNRLPASTTIEDVEDADTEWVGDDVGHHRRDGLEAIRAGEAAIVTLAAGVGSRWTQGAGVVKALNPFCRIAGKWRTFLDVHVAKAARIGRIAGRSVPHVVTTSHLTHAQIEAAGLPVLLSPGRAVGLRMIPMVRDLRFSWEESARQVLDERKQKMRDSVRAALVGWAERSGEGGDYADNTLAQCLHPVGHWYEVPNMLRNGVLAALLRGQPGLRWIMLHNIDTVGTDLDPAILGRHMASGAALGVEVIPRHVEDRGGGLARVNGRARLVEGLAMPREDDEWRLRFYNTLTTWIDLDALLRVFGLDKPTVLAAADGSASASATIADAIRTVAARMPTYVTLKEVKKRWGHGQEDIFPVAQFEKLWGDMTALPDVATRFYVVPRERGGQLKDVSQLDGWLKDGSAAAVEAIGDWN